MEANTIYNLDGKPIAAFNRGTAWSRAANKSLGYFDSGSVVSGNIFDLSNNPIAKFEDGNVISNDGKNIGRFLSSGYRHELYNYESQHIGSCIGSHGAAAAAIFFWGSIT